MRGESFTEVYTGTLGPSLRSIVPVRNSSGQIVGLVSAGITLETLAAHWRSQWPVIAALALAALGMSMVGVWAIRSRLQRQTRGLRPDELRVMYDHHDATLHSVSEGLIGFREKVAVANDEARRCWAFPPGRWPGRSCLSSCARRDPARPEVHVTDDRVLVVNRSPVKRSLSEVVTIRDRTELQGALGELSALKVLTDSLRSQARSGEEAAHCDHDGGNG